MSELACMLIHGLCYNLECRNSVIPLIGYQKFKVNSELLGRVLGRSVGSISHLAVTPPVLISMTMRNEFLNASINGYSNALVVRIKSNLISLLFIVAL